jgi:hypothetical protein
MPTKIIPPVELAADHSSSHFHGYILVCGISSWQPGGPESKCLGIDLLDFDITKEDLVKVFADMLKADLFEAEYLADEHPALVPTDVAAVVHPSCQEALRVDEFDQCARKHHGAGLVNAAGRLVVQSFVRPLVVEHLPEPIKLLLLKPQRECWRFRRVLFESYEGASACSGSIALTVPTLTLPSTADTVTVQAQDQFALGGAITTFTETAQ